MFHAMLEINTITVVQTYISLCPSFQLDGGGTFLPGCLGGGIGGGGELLGMKAEGVLTVLNLGLPVDSTAELNGLPEPGGPCDRPSTGPARSMRYPESREPRLALIVDSPAILDATEERSPGLGEAKDSPYMLLEAQPPTAPLPP
jgi:hypothetical protein